MMMNNLAFRVTPMVCVGNPADFRVKLNVIRAFDSNHERMFGDKKYVPDCMKNPGWAQNFVYFELRGQMGSQWFRVLGAN